MLKDPAKLVAEVQHDIEIVRKAHAQAKKNRGDDHYGLQLQSMTANIDKWANNGMESARLSKEPGAKGWKGWQEAGEAWLAGIHELDEMGAAEPGKLDAITAFVKDIPQETVKVTAKAAEAVKHATVAAAEAGAGDHSDAARRAAGRHARLGHDNYARNGSRHGKPIFSKCDVSCF